MSDQHDPERPRPDDPYAASNPYGSPPPQNPYGTPAWTPYGTGPGGAPLGPPPDHPQATTVLVLGVVGMTLCQVLGPFAWVMGSRTLREIDAAPGRYGARGMVQIGYVLGIVASVLLALSVVGLVLWFLFAVAFVASV